MLQDSVYTHDLKCRWMQWRTTVFDTTHIFHLLDSMCTYIDSASVRHFTRYGIATILKPNVDTLKWWITKRLTWLDAHMPGNCFDFSVNEKSQFENSLHVYPNPSAGDITIECVLANDGKFRFELYDLFGRVVRTVDISNAHSGLNRITLDLKEYARGVYTLKASGVGFVSARKIILE